MTIELLVGRALQKFRPPPIQKTADWCRQHMVLPPETPIPGPYKPWPMMEEVLNVIGDTVTERVTLMKAARIGYTKCLVGMVGKTVDTKPCSIIALLPREEDCKRFMNEEIVPVFAVSPRLKKVLREERDGGRNTMLNKSFAGGSLKAISAKSPANLRAHDAKYLIMDEVDAFVMTNEGDPVFLAERRTMAHADRKIIMGSTPTIEGVSIVAENYAKSDMRVFEVPCIHCGEFFEILWEHIVWPKGQPQKACLECPSCSKTIPERHKRSMADLGEWHKEAPHVEGHAGFRLNALVSPLPKASWSILAGEYHDAVHSGPMKVQGFVNTVEGRPYRDTQGSGVTAQSLYDRREDYEQNTVPEGALVLTAGVDFAPDSWECLIEGHGEGEETWEIDYIIHNGDATSPEYWKALTEVFERKWTHPHGGTMKLDAAALDSSDNTQRIYDYVKHVRNNGKSWVWAIKGMAGEGRPLWEQSTGKLSIAAQRGVKLKIVGVDTAKTMIYRNLGISLAGPGYKHFRNDRLEFYNQLLGEVVKTETVKGRAKRTWIPKNNVRHEVLDCHVYALAARYAISIDWEARKRRVKSKATGRKIDLAAAARSLGN